VAFSDGTVFDCIFDFKGRRRAGGLYQSLIAARSFSSRVNGSWNLDLFVRPALVTRDRSTVRGSVSGWRALPTIGFHRTRHRRRPYFWGARSSHGPKPCCP
jgi:hypothetical protein